MINSSIFSWYSGSDIIKQIINNHNSKSLDKYKGSFDRFLGNDCVDCIEIFPFKDYTLYKKDGFSNEQNICLFNQSREQVKIFINEYHKNIS
jgi:hypothetical protein